VGKALMIGGVFLLARDPRSLAEWYGRHLGWQLDYLADDDTYYTELYYREKDSTERLQHLVYAIMPGDPGQPGQGHIVNYRVDDIDAVVASLRAAGTETSELTVGPDATGNGRFVRLLDPEGHRIELWEHVDDV
jgi:catechol 2,3-dioxygenase-like lactoylglutathione lyase family enzyme